MLLLWVLGPSAADAWNKVKCWNSNSSQIFDDLFDSVNGSSLRARGGKLLRTAITSTSPDFTFWSNCKSALNNMYFIQNNIKVQPSLKNWVITLNGIEDIFKRLPKEEITFLKGRNLNQDPLENFFGQIRQRGGPCKNPTTILFQSFKTLMINNLTTRHSLHANCEEDTITSLTAIEKFVFLRPIPSTMDNVPSEVRKHVTIIKNMNITVSLTNKISKLATGYVAGFVYKKL